MDKQGLLKMLINERSTASPFESGYPQYPTSNDGLSNMRPKSQESMNPGNLDAINTGMAAKLAYNNMKPQIE